MSISILPVLARDADSGGDAGAAVTSGIGDSIVTGSSNGVELDVAATVALAFARRCLRVAGTRQTCRGCDPVTDFQRALPAARSDRAHTHDNIITATDETFEGICPGDFLWIRA